MNNPLNRYVKYPRTSHLPWSEGRGADDESLVTTDHFKNVEVVVTEKMDGENTTMYNGHIHARSLDSRDHPSRGWVKQFHATIQHDIPTGWRLCGENLYAAHSIKYNNLRSYFQLFSVWNQHNRCLSWDDTVEWAALLGCCTVPVLYRGEFDAERLIKLVAQLDVNNQEGYVVRVAGEFDLHEFNVKVAKFVRANHVQTDEHWMHQAVVANQLANNNEQRTVQP